MAPTCVSQQETESPQQSDKELNLQAVVFRSYEHTLLEVLRESDHAQFMAIIGLADFTGLSWTHVHQDLSMEFLRNYRKKKKSSRTYLSSSVRDRQITLNKKLIASTFQLSNSGYKHKVRLRNKEAISSLFDPVTARRNGYYIRDCKDPTYFERLEALNRLICLKPPGHLVSAVLVDMVIHATIQPVDWAGLLLVSLMKELDRVTCSRRQTPCTLVGVHIVLILANQKLVTPEDHLALEPLPFATLDKYSTGTSNASDSFRSLISTNPGSPPAGLLLTDEGVQLPSKSLSQGVHFKKGQSSIAATIRRSLKRLLQYVQCSSSQ